MFGYLEKNDCELGRRGLFHGRRRENEKERKIKEKETQDATADGINFIANIRNRELIRIILRWGCLITKRFAIKYLSLRVY